MGEDGSGTLLVESAAAVVEGLGLPERLRRQTGVGEIGRLDECRRRRVLEPLSLRDPVNLLQERCGPGSSGVLATDYARAEIRALGATYEAVDVLRHLALTALAARHSYQQGILHAPLSLARSLLVMGVSAFVPQGDALRADLASILGAPSPSSPVLLRCYRQAVLHGDDDMLQAVDRRICNDPLWGPWAGGAIDVLGEMVDDERVAMVWDFPSPLTDGDNMGDILNWLFRRR
jgi:hypothetical protein